MNLIIPMAGRGSRLRPHTLTVPKQFIGTRAIELLDVMKRHPHFRGREKLQNLRVVGHFVRLPHGT